MPEYKATMNLTFVITAEDDDDANFKLENVSGIVQGYLARTEFFELRPGISSALEFDWSCGQQRIMPPIAAFSPPQVTTNTTPSPENHSGDCLGAILPVSHNTIHPARREGSEHESNCQACANEHRPSLEHGVLLRQGPIAVADGPGDILDGRGGGVGQRGVRRP